MKIFCFLPVLVAAVPLAAQTCTTNPGSSVPDGIVSATANFTIGDGFITVSLANTLTDPKSVGQLLSGLQFTLASGLSTGTLGSSSANVRSVSKGGSFADLGPGPTGWALDTSNANFFLCILCTDLGALGPKRLLIGDPNSNTGAYTSSNASIAGNKPHNPFTAGTSIFFITAPTVVAGDTVTTATFFFGTTAGISANGNCNNVSPE